MKKIFFIIFGFVIIVFFSMGCATKSLWETQYAHSSYAEKINGFFINAQTKQIIFLGDKYNYFFDANSSLYTPFQHQGDPSVQFYMTNADTKKINHSEVYYENEDDITTVNFYISIDANTTNPKLLDWIQTERKMLEIQYSQSNNQPLLYIERIFLKGKRHPIDPKINQQTKEIHKLAKPIDLKIEDKQIKKNYELIPFQVVLTPLAVALDITIAIPVFILLMLDQLF